MTQETEDVLNRLLDILEHKERTIAETSRTHAQDDFTDGILRGLDFAVRKIEEIREEG